MDTEKELTENEKIPAVAISNHATVDQQSYMIGTRRLDRIPLEAAKRRLRLMDIGMPGGIIRPSV